MKQDADLVLIGDPFSAYCLKVAIALGKHGCAFRFDILDFSNAEAIGAFAQTWPRKRMPVDMARPYRSLFPLGAPDRD